MINHIISNYPKAIFLMGPTGSGKTKTAMLLHQHLPVEIISVDSALVYRDMNIGTAKPNKNELRLHKLIDIRNPSEYYSVANFCRDALKEMKRITKSGRIPLLVGGTMLYFKTLLEGLSPLPDTNLEMRRKINKEADIIGWKALHYQLHQIDPISANRIHPNDTQRISRALEVFYVSGNTLTEMTKISGKRLAYNVHKFAITPLDRENMQQRISKRFYRMLADGFEQEVSELIIKYSLHKDSLSLRCVGYRQMYSYLNGETNYDDMIFRIICATRQLVKHQNTWLRKFQDIKWLNNDKSIKIIDKISTSLNL